MASICNDPNGTKRITFINPDQARRTIYLGKIDLKSARSILRHVEALIAAKFLGEHCLPETAVWLNSISDELKQKLAKVGLIDPPKKTQLGIFLEGIILSRTDVKPATLITWQQSSRNLQTFFGADRELRTINAGECDQYKAFLYKEGLAAATIAKRLLFARTFFQTAVKHKLLDENPFKEVKVPSVDNAKRQAFVSKESIEKVLAIANPTWRTIIALSRFGGLRCPSEVLSIKWEHIYFEKGEMVVPSPKTERYDGKASRRVPIFADLLPYLLAAFEAKEEGQLYVVGGDYLEKAQTPKGWASCNLNTQFRRLILRAGLTVWPRIFHNLRASKETELSEQFPIQTVARWMGHDPQTSLKHYAQTTEDHFEQARHSAENSARVAQKAAQQGAGEKSTIAHEELLSGCGVDVYAHECQIVHNNVRYQDGAEED